MSKAEKDYYDFIGQRLGPLMCFFLFLAFRDWQKASFYAFSPDETQKMAEPISKIGPKVEELFRTPKWVHTLVTTSDDTVTLLMVFANYFERTGILDIILSPFFKPTLEKEVEKKHAEATRNGQNVLQPTGPIEQVQDYRNGYSRQAIDPRTAYTIGSQWSADI